MKLKEQYYVCVLAEYGSLTKAAEKLYLTQPALSNYINNLEHHLGIALFDRSGKNLTLTYAGECYVEKAKKMIELGNEFESQLHQIIQGYTGRIRLGVTRRRGSRLVPPAYARFKKEYPEVELVLLERNVDTLEELLEQEKIDLIIRNINTARTDLTYETLFKEHILLAVGADHPFNRYSKKTEMQKYSMINIETLGKENLILQHPYQNIRHEVDRILRHAKVVPHNIILVQNMETSMQMVAEGLGIGFNREGYATMMKYQKPVNYYYIENFQEASACIIGHKKGKLIPGYMKRMIEIMMEISEDF